MAAGLIWSHVEEEEEEEGEGMVVMVSPQDCGVLSD